MSFFKNRWNSGEVQTDFEFAIVKCGREIAKNNNDFHRIRMEIKRIFEDGNKNPHLTEIKLIRIRKLEAGYTLLCEMLKTIKSRIQTMAGQSNAPVDLEGCIGSIVFASEYTAFDLLPIKKDFVNKYGKKYIEKLTNIEQVDPSISDNFMISIPSKQMITFELVNLCREFNLPATNVNLPPSQFSDSLSPPLGNPRYYPEKYKPSSGLGTRPGVSQPSSRGGSRGGSSSSSTSSSSSSQPSVFSSPFTSLKADAHMRANQPSSFPPNQSSSSSSFPSSSFPPPPSVSSLPPSSFPPPSPSSFPSSFPSTIPTLPRRRQQQNLNVFQEQQFQPMPVLPAQTHNSPSFPPSSFPPFPSSSGSNNNNNNSPGGGFADYPVFPPDD